MHGRSHRKEEALHKIEKLYETAMHGMEETIVPVHVKKMQTSEEETTFVRLENKDLNKDEDRDRSK